MVRTTTIRRRTMLGAALGLAAPAIGQPQGHPAVETANIRVE